MVLQQMGNEVSVTFLQQLDRMYIFLYNSLACQVLPENDRQYIQLPLNVLKKKSPVYKSTWVCFAELVNKDIRWQAWM